jgi:sugar (glycoside-pentoside-hexuronide) transporter
VLSLRVKSGYALGDHTINVHLAALSLFYLFFLTEIAGLPPSRAGLVLLIGRAVDAFTDPLMGRLSDVTPWRIGRRRPFFLIGALPFGVTFSLLWSQSGLEGELAVFLFYSLTYVLNTVSSTVLAVPYVALLPEIALGYHERTSINSFRSVAVMSAILLTAVGMPALVRAFGGGAAGYQQAGLVLGLWVALPWLLVFAVTWERPGFRRPSSQGFLPGLRGLTRHRTYRILAALFLSGRIAVDVSGAMLLFYFTYWLRRPDDFPVGMALMLGAVILSLPVWLRLARHLDKRSIFISGALWWSAGSLGLLWLEPSDPRWSVFVIFAFVGIGYAVADLIPWSMLGDVIDEDELATGERREGIYSGFFTFLRKLGGAIGVAAAGFVLEGAGFVRGGAVQSDSALQAIRLLTTLGPVLFLLIACCVALAYPLTRSRHGAILTQLAERGRRTPG